MEPEAITEEPTDLRPLQPTGIGFLTRSRNVDDFSTHDAQQQFLVVNRFAVLDVSNRSALKNTLSNAVNKILHDPELSAKVQTFWVVEYDIDLKDDTVVTIERYVTKEAYETARQSLAELL